MLTRFQILSKTRDIAWRIAWSCNPKAESFHFARGIAVGLDVALRILDFKSAKPDHPGRVIMFPQMREEKNEHV